MELGKRIREARLSMGLSQRALCGDAITRNMLSQIENGSARPSMETLRYLAARLGKTVSYFLEEETVTSPNQAAMADARQALRAGRWQQVLAALGSCRGEDPVFREEMGLLRYLALTALARQALEAGQKPYAADLLEQAGTLESIYITAALRREAMLLTARVTGRGKDLPNLDAELLLYARAALEAGDPVRCAGLLDGCGSHSGPQWNLLRGRAYLAAEEFSAAAGCLHRAEEAYPTETAPLLEHAYRELGDFRMAYEYACRQR